MSKLTVAILVTIPKPEHFDACTLCFDTLRVGFPTADIEVYLNDWAGTDEVSQKRLAQKVYNVGAGVCMLAGKVHHADWIRKQVASAKGPRVILDADTIFWQSCEDWEFDKPLAGYYVPQMWNDFAKCISFPRLHTSFLWIAAPSILRQKIRAAYLPAHEEAGEYCPCEPFMPATRFINGRPFFWDSCANLYGMVGGAHFTEEHKACYDHLNSAAFYDVMLDRLENKEGFAYAHRFLTKTPEKLRGLWRVVDAYYAEKAAEADRRLNTLANNPLL